MDYLGLVYISTKPICGGLAKSKKRKRELEKFYVGEWEAGSVFANADLYNHDL